MKTVITKGCKHPIKLWLELDDYEQDALDQAVNLANLPFVFRHVAIMPDSHVGYGMPIGGVLATENAIIPNAVGVDIGCGMCAERTNVSVEDLDVHSLKTIMSHIRKLVPVGFSRHKSAKPEDMLPSLDAIGLPNSIVYQEYERARKQVGTLGGGNHFIEIQAGSDGFVWVMIHSGSRNIGFKVAKYYNEEAKRLNDQWYSQIPLSHDLAFLPSESRQARCYIAEMNYCVEFALANRQAMLDSVKDAFNNVLVDVAWDNFVNLPHNYVAQENHFGKNVWVHRKGATRARKGELGIVPGSQGTKSYIVRGLGNPESFQSCSHGAGRVMGRKAAQRTLNIDEEKRRLDERGIVHSIRSIQDLDEAPSAYKDIDVVMANQSDLVKIVTELSPMGVIKG
jgi:tRNA-splicing ligase RtcB